MAATGRDRLRELLDAVLDEGNDTLDAMAHDASSSPFHFSRLLSRDVGEPPVSLRRRLASIVANVLTFSAHRRQLVRHLLRVQGHQVDYGDPIDWLRSRTTDPSDSTGGIR